MTTFEYLQHLKVQRGIDCFGMSPDQLARVCEVGYDQWLSEYESTPTKARTGTTRCAMGSKCFNATNRKAAFGTGKYCSATCKGAAQAARSREKAAWQASNPEMVGIQ
jgi:hypothetical protein